MDGLVAVADSPTSQSQNRTSLRKFLNKFSRGRDGHRRPGLWALHLRTRPQLLQLGRTFRNVPPIYTGDRVKRMRQFHREGQEVIYTGLFKPGNMSPQRLQQHKQALNGHRAHEALLRWLPKLSRSGVQT